MIYRKTMDEILFLSLKDLLLTRSFSEITIQNIVNNCEVSRTTFYRYYDDKYELAFYGYFNFLSKEMRKLKTGELEVDQFTKNTINYFFEEKEFYKKLLQYKGQNSFEEQFRNETIKRTFSYCQTKLNIKKLPLELDFQIKYFAAAHTYLILNWVENGCILSTDEFYRLLVDSYPNQLHKFIE